MAGSTSVTWEYVSNYGTVPYRTVQCVSKPPPMVKGFVVLELGALIFKVTRQKDYNQVTMIIRTLQTVAFTSSLINRSSRYLVLPFEVPVFSYLQGVAKAGPRGLLRSLLRLCRQGDGDLCDDGGGSWVSAHVALTNYVKTRQRNIFSN